MNSERKKLLADLRSYPLLISEIIDPDLELQLVAVNSFPLAVLFIKEPHIEIQKIVVTRDQNDIRHINNPSPQLINLIEDPFLKEETLERIKKNQENLFFNNKTEK